MIVELQIERKLAIITFNRPLQGNSIDRAFGEGFLATASAIAAAPDIRAVLLTGAGKHFCVGGDLNAMAESGSDTHSYLTMLTANLHDGIGLLAKIDAPVVAAVNGTAAGAGLGLVLGSDIAIASKSAKFVAAYSGVALTPDAGCSYYLPRAVGSKRAMEMFMTNRILDAQEALAWGLVNQVVEDGELAQAARACADRLVNGPIRAFGALKRLMSESLPGLDAQLVRESISIANRGASEEGREGIDAFLMKRLPKYP